VAYPFEPACFPEAAAGPGKRAVLLPGHLYFLATLWLLVVSSRVRTDGGSVTWQCSCEQMPDQGACHLAHPGLLAAR